MMVPSWLIKSSVQLPPYENSLTCHVSFSVYFQLGGQLVPCGNKLLWCKWREAICSSRKDCHQKCQCMERPSADPQQHHRHRGEDHLPDRGHSRSQDRGRQLTSSTRASAKASTISRSSSTKTINPSRNSNISSKTRPKQPAKPSSHTLHTMTPKLSPAPSAENTSPTPQSTKPLPKQTPKKCSTSLKSPSRP